MIYNGLFLVARKVLYNKAIKKELHFLLLTIIII